MNFQKFWKKAKHMLAFVLAITLFFNGWSNYDFSVYATGSLDVELASGSAVYTGGDLTPSISSVNDANGADVTEYDVIWKDSDGNQVTEIKDSGTYEVTVTSTESVDDGAGNVTEKTHTGTADFTVNAIDLSACTVTADNVTYTGAAIEPVNVVVKSGENVVEADLYGVADIANNINAGTATFKVNAAKDNRNITGSTVGSFEISAKALTDAMVTISPESAIVNGENHASNVSVTVKDTVNDNEVALTKDTDYETVIQEEIKNQGSYTVTVTGLGNYSGSVEKTFTLSYATDGTAVLEGNTFKNNVYANSVTVKPAEGYTISESPNGEFAAEIVYTETPTDYIVYLKNVDNQITEFELPVRNFTIDSEDPTLTLTAPSTEWASSKEIGVNVQGATCVYYTKGNKVELGSPISHNTSLDGLTPVDGNLKIEETITKDITYYFYAFDDAGHMATAEIVINNVDTTAPEISINKQIPNYDENNKVFWKNTEDLEISVTAKEKVSSIASIEVSGNAGWECTYADNNSTANGTLTISEAGSYEIKVIDKAGNEIVETITVDQDTEAPEVALSEPTGTGTYKNENGEYWFSDAGVIVPITVRDETAEEDTDKAPYTVVYSTDEEFANVVEVLTVTDGKTDTAIELGNAGTAVTYYFKVTDMAGNEGSVQSVQLGYDDSSVEIRKTVLTQLGDDEWLNKAELGSENFIEIFVEAKDSETGIQKIEYSSDNGANYTEVDTTNIEYTEANVSYTFKTKETYSDGTNYQWKIRVTNNVGRSSEQAIAGGKIDTTVPESTAYIKFKSDTAGKNDENRGSISEGKWSSNIYQIATEAWNKIWGKTEVTFEVYVQDVTSGIDTINMSYNDSSVTVTHVEGLKAFSEGDASASAVNDNAVGYTVFEGSITYSGDDGLAIRNFRIDSLTDIAGNTTSDKIVLNTAENKEIIYLDAVAPTLSVQIDNKVVDTEEKYYFKETQTLVLTIDERFFGEESMPVYPKVTVSKRSDANADFTEDTTLSTNIWKNVGSNLWQASIPLNEANVEMEYMVSLEAYEDPSGNILTAAEGVTGVKDDGSFTSKIFVVDYVVPQLVSYNVNEATVCEVNEISVYKNAETDDLEVGFAINDNAAYYTAENLVVKVYKDSETEAILTLDGTGDILKPIVSERNHAYIFTFDGGETPENEFHVEIEYKDAAGNPLENNAGLTGVKGKEGVYESESYIIDHVAPVFNVEYSDAANVVQGGINHEGKKPISEYTAYYNQDIKVKLTFDEKYVNRDEKGTLEHFVFEITKDGETLKDDKVPELTWSTEGTINTAEFTIPAKSENDGNYQFVVKYRDCAENAMVGDKANTDLENLMGTETVKSEENGKEETFGVYTSPILVMDTTAPVVTTAYMNSENVATPNQTVYGRDYFIDLNTSFKIEVVDRNIRYSELKDVLSGVKAYDINNNDVESDLAKEISKIVNTNVQWVPGTVAAEKNTWILNLPLTTAANYDIPVDFTDLAGNKAVVNGSVETFTEYVTTDSEDPDFDLSYSIEDPANYLKWGYLFAKSQMNIKVTATDETSGIQWIKFTIIEENGKETERFMEFAPTGRTEYSVDIPLMSKDFKGSVLTEVVDYSTNDSEKTRGHIVESAEKHSATGKAVITTITSPSRTVGGVDFYNTDVKFKLTLEDTYSGLASWEYVGGETLDVSKSYKEEVGSDLEEEPKQEITYLYEQELTLSASGNNKNDVLVTASYIDNAGHTNEVEQKYNIDITKPEIEVTYDLNEPANGKYYNATRTATVRIRERNFDPSDVEFLITSTDGPKPSISDWSSSGSGDNTYHTCTVEFAQDSDYTFTLKFQDMAGNVADYDRVDEFTIDKTIPVATVTYDNNQFLNEYYYDATRTATIDILEHNFDATAIEVMITADGATTGIPRISAWSSNGDHNIATVTFSADAEYTFDIAGVDLALNELEDYTPDHFVVDQTAPELEIFDIEHMSANNGVVRPGIRYYDTNYDADGTVILMTGYHNGVVEMTGARKLEANGLELKLDDFAYVQELDDIYTMHATVYDLAGNSSEETVMFSVNRFGSVYTFDEKTDALIGDGGKYYTNKEQELVITETNVDTLEFKEITCNLNGKLTTLKEGADYTVSLDGSEATWKQYTYTINAENFVEEGTYILTIYSEDRATNTSDNSSKGKKIEFVVDKTNPSVLIAGVENGGQYRANNQEMTIDIEDNVRLSQVIVTIDGVETVYDAAQINEVDGKLVLNIGSANHWQEVKVVVTDAAGNEAISEEMRVLVTANIFVQFFMNKPVFYGSLGTLAVIAALLWWFLVGKKKKNEEEAK